MSWLCSLLRIGCVAGTLSGHATIYDGDTIYVNQQAVRLAGIDAEELDEANGPRARDHLRQLVAGSVVRCEWQGWSYSRRVGVCWTFWGNPSVNLNKQMVQDGFALDCARYSGGAYRQLEPASIRLRLTQKGYC